jgi:hypothetical protein
MGPLPDKSKETTHDPAEKRKLPLQPVPLRSVQLRELPLQEELRLLNG